MANPSQRGYNLNAFYHISITTDYTDTITVEIRKRPNERYFMQMSWDSPRI